MFGWVLKTPLILLFQKKVDDVFDFDIDCVVFFSEFCVTAAVDVKNLGLYVFAFLLLTSAYRPQI